MTVHARAAAIVVATLVLVTGCSGDGGSDRPTRDDSAPRSFDRATTPGTVSPELAPTPQFQGDPRGVIRDVEIARCSTSPGRVTAAGTATNSADRTRDIAVTISWAVPGGGDVLARASATLRDIAPQDTVRWTVRTRLDRRANVECVPAALRGSLEGRD